jgi:hypothetical protein
MNLNMNTCEVRLLAVKNHIKPNLSRFTIWNVMKPDFSKYFVDFCIEIYSNQVSVDFCARFLHSCQGYSFITFECSLLTGLDETRRARHADKDLMISDCKSQRSPTGNKYYTHDSFVNVLCVPNEAWKTLYTRMGSMVATWNRLCTAILLGQSHVHVCRC